MTRFFVALAKQLWNWVSVSRITFTSSDTQLMLVQDLFQLFNFLWGGVFRRQMGNVGFDDFSDIEDVANVVIRVKKCRRQRLDQSLFARSENIVSVSLAALEELHGFEGADGFPDGRTGDLEGFGQFPFRGKLIATLQFSILDEVKDLLYDVLICPLLYNGLE